MAKKAKLKTTVWDPAASFTSSEDAAHLLRAAFADGDPQIIADVVGDIARAHGMQRIAEKTGLGRNSLYKSLRSDGNPQFATMVKVMDALGWKLSLDASAPRTKPKRAA